MTFEDMTTYRNVSAQKQRDAAIYKELLYSFSSSGSCEAYTSGQLLNSALGLTLLLQMLSE